MKLFRNESGLNAFTLFTGIIFLNMSFILGELCSLDLTDLQMIENVCNLIRNGGVEENSLSRQSNLITTFQFLEWSAIAPVQIENLFTYK